MDKFLEKVMNFINENTMMLIIICIFLIIILVIYLIDNTIKTKRLEQAELAKKENPEPTVEDTNVSNEPEVKAPVSPIEINEPVVEEPETVTSPIVEETNNSSFEEENATETYIEQETNSNIDELLNKDFSANNELVESIPDEPVVEEPKSKYNNDKKLSDIFGKKKEPVKSIETTQDFSDELDRILQKLNEDSSTSVEDTSDYTNMF